MSFNRLSYDTCRYARELNGNTSILGYLLDNQKFEHPKKCRHNLGLVAGANISQVKGNIIDMESELKGITRLASQCAESKVKPLEESSVIINDKTAPIDTSKMHLPTCQMFAYSSVPMPPPMNLPYCKK